MIPAERIPWETPFELEALDQSGVRHRVELEGEKWDELPKVKEWIEAVNKDQKANESLLLYVRFHPQPRMAILEYLHYIKARKPWAKEVLEAMSKAKDINALLDDVNIMLRMMNFEHSKKDAAFGATFTAEKKLRDDIGEAVEKIATWRRVRAYQVKAVVEPNKWRMGIIGKDFVDVILKDAFPKLRKRIKESAVPSTIDEQIGWGFQTMGKARLTSDARFKHLVEVEKRRRGL